jgi:branched-chain amino acid aminotransferase
MRSFPYGICCDTVVSIEKVRIPENIEEKVYEVMRIIDGKILYFEEHMDRMEKSIRFYLPHFELDRNKVLDLVKDLIDCIGIDRVNLRIEGYLRKDSHLDLIGYLVRGEYPTEEMYLEGVVVKGFNYERINPTIKAINQDYKATVNRFIKENGIYEAVLYHDKHVTEGSRSNLFFIKNGCIYSAREEDVLSGITRQKVVETIGSMNIENIQKDILVGDIDQYEAAFLTGTSIHILPIRLFDNKRFDTDHPLLRELMKEFQKTLEKHMAL